MLFLLHFQCYTIECIRMLLPIVLLLPLFSIICPVFLLFAKIIRLSFSFRGVLLDGLSIVFLTLMSRIYPIIHYKIATFYTMIGSFLIFWVILLYSITIFILINIVKRDSNQTSLNQTSIMSL